MRTIHLFKNHPLQWLLLALDAIGVVLCFYIAHWHRIGMFPQYSTPIWVIAGLTIGLFYLLDCYAIESPDRVLNTIAKVLLSVGATLILSGLYIYLIGQNQFNPLYGRGILPVALIGFFCWASLCRYLLIKLPFIQQKQRLLYIGPLEKAQWLAQENEKNELHLRLFCLLEKTELSHLGRLAKCVGSYSDLSSLSSKNWDFIVFDNLSDLPDEIEKLLIDSKISGKPVYSISEFAEKVWTKIPILHIGDSWIMNADGFALLGSTLSSRFKLIFDICLAITLLVILSPLLLITAVIVRLDSKGPFLYKQDRVGLRGAIFQVRKFRTMHPNAESNGAQWAVKNDPRITRVGRWLRKLRLDELPQIWNVIKGEMSFIGPRPERPIFVEQLKNDIPYYDLRHTVKPGITGWAQVMHSYTSTTEGAREKLEFDLYYIKNQSLLLDLTIFFKTLKTILSAQGH